MKDVQSEQQISGRLKTSQTGGGANFIILTERKYGIVIFMTLRLKTASIQPAQNQIFASSFR